VDGVLPAGPGEFIMRRSDVLEGGALLPCYFFKNGAIEMGAWVEAFCDALFTATENEEFVTGVGAPVAVVVSAEDIREASVNWETYGEYLLDPYDRDTNSEYLIDPSHTLAQWNTDFAKTRSGATLSLTPVNGAPYSPENEDLHSYLQSTLQTAYNHAREESTWSHFRALWPRAHLSQYVLGNRYGVTVEVEEDYVPVPVGPGESYYHGTRNWQGPVAWDAYYCLTNPYHGTSAESSPDQGHVPLYQPSATFMRGVADGGTTTTVVVDHFTPDTFFNPSYYITESLPVFVQFTTGANSYPVTIYPVASWSGSTFTLPTGTSLAAAPSADDEFVVYFPSGPGYEFLHDEIEWPLMRTFCNLYFDDEEALSSSMFLETSKKWAAECARAQTRALPDNPYTLYYGPGAYPAVYGNVSGLKVSFLATYPEPSFTTTDGWLSGQDWGDVGKQAIKYGVNDFAWYSPPFVYGTAPNYVASDTVPVVAAAIQAMNDMYWQDVDIYEAMACIADWDQSGLLNHDDVKDYYTAYSNADPIADLNNDGEFTQADVTIFDQADGCGLEIDCDGNDIADSEEIALDPLLDTNDNDRLDICEGCVADWCGDGVVGVPDIFCFLSAWFAQNTQAYCLGGTCGVPAIFHFLALWFGHGNGPCVT